MTDRLSVKQAAKVIGVTPALLRYQMDMNIWDLGAVARSKNGRRSHIIFRAKVEKLLGRELKEGEVE